MGNRKRYYRGFKRSQRSRHCLSKSRFFWVSEKIRKKVHHLPDPARPPLGYEKNKGFDKVFPYIQLPRLHPPNHGNIVIFNAPELVANQLILGDNLQVLRTIPSETIDLIYIDPPFFSGRNYNVIWGDTNEIRSFYDIWEGGIDSYLIWLNARLWEMRRVKAFFDEIKQRLEKDKLVKAKIIGWRFNRQVVEYIKVLKRYIEMFGGIEETQDINLSSRKVFIVHGHNEQAKSELALILTRLGLEPIILNEQPTQGMTLIEKLERHYDVGFAFVLLTPDDKGCQKGQENNLLPRARQNVVFEFGLFVGKLSRNRVCCLYTGEVEIPSDLQGLVYLPFKSSVNEIQLDIVREL
ncbi:MAG: TIR domain-containing protein [bacterium]